MIDRVIEAFLGARADTRDQLAGLLAEHPDCTLGHCLDGYLYMMSSKRENQPLAVAALDRAKAGVSRQDRLHVAALEAWSRGDLREAAEHWDGLLTEFPRDL